MTPDAERVLRLLNNSISAGETFGRLTVIHMPEHGRFGRTTVRVRCVVHVAYSGDLPGQLSPCVRGHRERRPAL